MLLYNIFPPLYPFYFFLTAINEIWDLSSELNLRKKTVKYKRDKSDVLIQVVRAKLTSTWVWGALGVKKLQTNYLLTGWPPPTTAPRGIELFLPEPLWVIGLISTSNEPNYKSSCNGLIKKSNFICYSLKIRLEMAEIAIWLRKNKATKPNSKPNQPFLSKPLGSSIFVS